MATAVPPAHYFNAYADKPGHDGDATTKIAYQIVCTP
jgi:hypothetical protein